MTIRTDPTKRSRLHLARQEDAPRVSSLSLVKKALRLYRGRGVPKAVYRRNALAWVACRERMGDNHILKGMLVRWGQPGEPYTDQVYAPRRQGGK